MIRFSAQWQTISLMGPSDHWIFQPQNDITPIELGLSLIPLLTERADLVGGLPPLALRHWRRDTSYPAQRMNAVAPDASLMERSAELAAVTGVPLEAEWTRIAVVLWPGMEDREMGLCWRRKEA